MPICGAGWGRALRFVVRRRVKPWRPCPATRALTGTGRSASLSRPGAPSGFSWPAWERIASVGFRRLLFRGRCEGRSTRRWSMRVTRARLCAKVWFCVDYWSYLYPFGLSLPFLSFWCFASPLAPVRVPFLVVPSAGAHRLGTKERSQWIKTVAPPPAAAFFVCWRRCRSRQ